MNYILYHANCMDGFASAWAYNHLVGKLAPENQTYIPMTYNEALPNMQKEDSIIMLDYSIKKDALIALCKEVASVTIIDHHKTAIEDLASLYNFKPSNLSLCLDKERSGCGLTWDYYESGYVENRPYFINLIEDRDLWRFNFNASKAFHEAAIMLPKDFDVWDDLLVFENVTEQVTKGYSILSYVEDTVKSIANNKSLLQMWAGTMLMINCPPKFASEVGNYVAKEFPKAYACMYYVHAQTVFYSLRSVGELDCSRIAMTFGGGGHKNAAGFSTSLSESHLVMGMAFGITE